MVAPPTPPLLTLLECEYFSPLERHTMRLHTRAINPTPVMPGDDYDYMNVNVDPSAELRVTDTLTNLATIWSQYYAIDWTFALRGLWGFDGTTWTEILPLTLWPPHVGSLPSAQFSGDPTMQRVFHIRSALFRQRRIWLRQTPPVSIQRPLEVTPTTGGVDMADQATMAYLTGGVTALLAPDGEVFVTPASVRTWWDRPRAFPWTADALA